MMTSDEILNWLKVDQPRRLEALWQQADDVRRRHVGDAVHLRGLVELSNHCRRSCHYCGLRAPNRRIARYRLSADEVIQCAEGAVALGYGTVVLQAGEDPQHTRQWIADLIVQIRDRTPLAITLSLGERSDEDLQAWRDAGADRYLLRFEASNPALFAQIHPDFPGGGRSRIDMLERLRQMGYQTGSGMMVGLPGQTWRDLAGDIALLGSMELDMIGIGPFIPHPQTPLGQSPVSAGPEQVRADELTTYKAVALARLVNPDSNIPATTALATINPAQGRELGLQRGANIIMPNITPVKYRAMYEIYPGKVCQQESAGDCRDCVGRRIASIGRTVGTGRGDSPRFLKTGVR